MTYTDIEIDQMNINESENYATEETIDKVISVIELKDDCEEQ